MVLQMFIDGKLIENVPLSVHKIRDYKERDAYIQGAMNELLEKWSDLLEAKNLEPQFYINGEFPFQ
jgi:hypothetical protein